MLYIQYAPFVDLYGINAQCLNELLIDYTPMSTYVAYTIGVV